MRMKGEGEELRRGRGGWFRIAEGKRVTLIYE